MQVPKRLRHALADQHLLVLLQVVPAAHLTTLAATLKHDAEFMKTPATAERVLVSFYKQHLEGGRSLRAPSIASYINCCRSLGRKVNLRIKSASRLMKERDAMAREREIDRIPDIRTRPEFILRRTDFPEVGLELINSRSRLRREARRMRSCVAAYGRSVAAGRCSLYHVRYRGRHYTLELRLDRDGKLYCNQVTGVENAPATARLENMLDRYVGRAQPRCSKS